MFLDRDGVIARDVHYCRRVEDFEILPGVTGAIKLLNGHGFRVVVITNQSGIARGFFTEATLHQIHRHMERELARQGARVDAIYYCPHHPDDGCQCRKPRPGLLLKAAQELGIDLAKSFMVGDSEIDIQTGKAAGCQTILITSEPDKTLVDPPDYVAESLLRAVKWIIDQA
ncbi:MAG: D-glycero-beta-D-manno-heptose 1,7-bisphosphate 7-phosphatase [bacterium]|nr:D-glycero-beta-D-manno-heptose 1,7-bisphosphate 7-phosphatase [bacterium]